MGADIIPIFTSSKTKNMENLEVKELERVLGCLEKEAERQRNENPSGQTMHSRKSITRIKNKIKKLQQ